ncbi:MAG TPA: helix-turn-helix transcriptional regulator [Gemmataceae bacterium]|jgi:transcriptional regulator with XRE-family HTH domain|nr:helix-turn-helix transcriptional regulator [Gemmataceae bacterium]
MVDNLELYERCYLARLFSGLSSEGAALVLGIGLGELIAIETGICMPSHARLELMARVYGVALPWLVDGKPTRIEPALDRMISYAQRTGHPTSASRLKRLLQILP